MGSRDPERTFENVRLERERRTIDAMVETFCRDHHGPTDGPVCAECADFEAYARLRLEKCPYGETKPTCVNCPIHCYQPQRREQVRRIMAYSGPRMLLRHPILAIRHILDGHRKAPPLSSLARADGAGLRASGGGSAKTLTALLLAAPVLSSLLLGAHFLRSGSAAGVFAALLPLAFVFVRRPWAARACQAILLFGALEWIRTLAALVEARRAANVPHARLAAILGAVAAFTAASALAYETRRLRERYGTRRRV